MGTDPKHLEGSTRDVIQEWQEDPDNPCKDGEHKIGDRRKIKQKFSPRLAPKPGEFEYRDPNVTHKWLPYVPDRTYKNY